jgi:hypothetical protein
MDRNRSGNPINRAAVSTATRTSSIQREYTGLAIEGLDPEGEARVSRERDIRVPVLRSCAS